MEGFDFSIVHGLVNSNQSAASYSICIICLHSGNRWNELNGWQNLSFICNVNLYSIACGSLIVQSTKLLRICLDFLPTKECGGCVMMISRYLNMKRNRTYYQIPKYIAWLYKYIFTLLCRFVMINYYYLMMFYTKWTFALYCRGN